MDTEISMTIPVRGNSTFPTTLVLTAVAVVVPFFVSGYERTLIQKALLWIPSVFGVYILYSLLRQVHFGQSIFVGIGSYIVAFSAGKYAVTSELMILLPAALVITIVVAYILGIFITKRTGFYFAVMGIAVTMVFWSLVYKARAITGGSDGISHIKSPTLFSIPLNDLGLYYFCLAVSVGMILLMLRILNSSFSLQLRAIAGDLEKAESIGIPVKRMQRIAFTIAGANAGVTGVLLAFAYNYVSPSAFEWGYGANFVQSAIIGGVNSVAGPIVGAFGFINLEFFISTWFANYWEIIIGLTIAIIVVTVGEEGVTGIAQSFVGKIRGKLRNSQESTDKHAK
ncbi:MAG: branched-chain amino acid ABC transporter permease [Syntrophobacteraceae bacterium]